MRAANSCRSRCRWSLLPGFSGWALMERQTPPHQERCLWQSRARGVPRPCLPLHYSRIELASSWCARLQDIGTASHGSCQ